MQHAGTTERPARCGCCGGPIDLCTVLCADDFDSPDDPDITGRTLPIPGVGFDWSLSGFFPTAWAIVGNQAEGIGGSAGLVDVGTHDGVKVAATFPTILSLGIPAGLILENTNLLVVLDGSVVGFPGNWAIWGPLGTVYDLGVAMADGDRVAMHVDGVMIDVYINDVLVPGGPRPGTIEQGVDVGTFFGMFEFGGGAPVPMDDFTADICPVTFVPVADDFTGPDGPLLGRLSPTGGQPWSVFSNVSVGGDGTDWEIVGNRAENIAATGNSWISIAVAGAAHTNVSARVTATTGLTFPGLSFYRYGGTPDGILDIAGFWTSTLGGAGPAVADGDILRMDIDEAAGTMESFVNEVSFTGPTPIPNFIRTGVFGILGSGAVGEQFEDFSVSAT